MLGYSSLNSRCSLVAHFFHGWLSLLPLTGMAGHAGSAAGAPTAYPCRDKYKPRGRLHGHVLGLLRVHGRVHGSMDGCTSPWTGALVHGWVHWSMDGCMGALVHGWVHGCIGPWMGTLVHGWVHWSMDGYTGPWMVHWSMVHGPWMVHWSMVHGWCMGALVHGPWMVHWSMVGALVHWSMVGALVHVSAILATFASIDILWPFGPNNGSGNGRKVVKITTFLVIPAILLGQALVYLTLLLRKSLKMTEKWYRKRTTFLPTAFLL